MTIAVLPDAPEPARATPTTASTPSVAPAPHRWPSRRLEIDPANSPVLLAALAWSAPRTAPHRPR